MHDAPKAPDTDPTEQAGVRFYRAEGSLPALATEARGSAVLQAAKDVGFSRAGACSAERFPEAQAALSRWLSAGMNGTMNYLEVPTERGAPETLMIGARSVLVVALSYPGPVQRSFETRSSSVSGSGASRRQLPLLGEVAAYAHFEDYHVLMKERLHQLGTRIAGIWGRPVRGRACVDTAPLLEREAAARAGIGFTGKSTMTIVPGVGTYVLLGSLLLDVELDASLRLTDGCGACTECLDACPTGAFVAPYVLDARRCISYLTIESRSPIPRELRSKIGVRVFGCDVCQAVCPYNAGKGRSTALPGERRLESNTVELTELLHLRSAAYRRLVTNSAMRRVSRVQLQRNAAVALGNSHNAEAVPALAHALATNPSPLVRGHSAWALGHLGTAAAIEALVASRLDRDELVREEVEAALLVARTSPGDEVPQGPDSSGTA